MFEMVPHRRLEQEFWRQVVAPGESVSVKYGADLFADEVGSGFPTATEDTKLNILDEVGNTVDLKYFVRTRSERGLRLPSSRLRRFSQL